MMFKEWLYNEMKHFLLEENPITLTINGSKRKVTGIDFKWEDFGQQKLAIKHFVQEFPHDVGVPGQVFVNAGYFDGYWIEELNPADLHKMKRQGKVFGDTEEKRILPGKTPNLGPNKPPISFEVNPLNEFLKIDPKSLTDPEGGPANFHPPYNRKATLSWWDFAEVYEGHEVIKRAARVR